MGEPSSKAPSKALSSFLGKGLATTLTLTPKDLRLEPKTLAIAKVSPARACSCKYKSALELSDCCELDFTNPDPGEAANAFSLWLRIVPVGFGNSNSGSICSVQSGRFSPNTRP